VSRPAPRRRWARAGNVLLVVLVTALQLVGLRSVRAPDLLAGVAGEVLGVATALIGGVALWWRRSRPVSVLARVRRRTP
jgi:nitrate reductase gamma subunit